MCACFFICDLVVCLINVFSLNYFKGGSFAQSDII